MNAQHARLRNAIPALKLWAAPLAIYCASRAMVYMCFEVATRIGHQGTVEGLSGWDGAWFGSVANNGYDKAPEGAVSNTAFFPLFPLITRAVMAVTNLHFHGAATVVNFVFGAVFALAIWALAKHLLDEDAGNRAVALACFFPGMLVFSMFYSEPIMLAFSALCLLALVKNKWILAGIAAALATAARFSAIALCLACLVAAMVAIRERRDWRSITAPVLSPLGVLAYFVYLAAHTGDFFAYFRVQTQGWGQKLDPGYQDVLNIWKMIQHPVADYNIVNQNIALLVIVAGVVCLGLWRKPRPPIELHAYTIGSLIITATYLAGPLPRFALAAIPLFLAMAKFLKSPAALGAVVGCFATITALCCVLIPTSTLITP